MPSDVVSGRRPGARGGARPPSPRLAGAPRRACLSTRPAPLARDVGGRQPRGPDVTQDCRIDKEGRRSEHRVHGSKTPPSGACPFRPLVAARVLAYISGVETSSRRSAPSFSSARSAAATRTPRRAAGRRTWPARMTGRRRSRSSAPSALPRSERVRAPLRPARFLCGRGRPPPEAVVLDNASLQGDPDDQALPGPHRDPRHLERCGCSTYVTSARSMTRIRCSREGICMNTIQPSNWKVGLAGRLCVTCTNCSSALLTKQ